MNSLLRIPANRLPGGAFTGRLFCSLAAALLLASGAVQAIAQTRSFAEVRALGGKRHVPLSGSVEGIIVSDWRSDNMEHNPNIDHSTVDLGENLRTAYVESTDGALGFRLKFSGIYGNRLAQGDLVRISLEGCRLIREESPERYTIEGIEPVKVEFLGHGLPLPEKRRHVSELTPEDVYTHVTLPGVEFSKKSGGYINVNERYVQTTELNRYLYCPDPFNQGPTENADCWARLMLDDEGSPIYLLVNSTCLWRRNNGGVPQGRGEVSGIIVHDSLRRYGASLGDYSIRPLDLRGFAMARENGSAYSTLAQWEWDYNAHAELSLQNGGRVRFPKPESLRGDKILAEEGSGLLWTDSGAWMSLGDEYDARHSFDGWKPARMTGSRSNAALRLDCSGTSWAGKSVYVETSTAGITGKALTFVFSFVEGMENSNGSYAFPVEWKVSWSTDGSSWTELPQLCLLRPMAYTNILHGKRLVQVHSEAAVGFPEHCLRLPDSLFGQERLLLRISPCSSVSAVIPERWDDSSTTGDLSRDGLVPVTIRFGTVSLKYLK